MNRCGACGTICPARANATRNCTAGVCGFTCASGSDNCDGNADNGCEANIQADLDRCGSCSTVCPTRANASRTCVSGTCGFTCSAGFANCDANPDNGCEVNTQTNVDRCGSCSTVCPDRPQATRTCAGGVCGFACEAGFSDCNGMAADGCEVDTQTNVDRCGGCSTICPARPNAARTCVAGSCGYECNPGFADCNGLASDGCEVNLAADPSNCGSCTAVCPTAPFAVSSCSGSCAVACQANRADCNGDLGASGSDGCEIDLLVEPAAIDIFPASGAVTRTTRPSFVVVFNQPVDTSIGLVTIERMAPQPSLTYDLSSSPPEITFHDGGREMRIRPNLYLQRGETLQMSWTGLREATGCSRLFVQPSAWSVTVSACAPGQGAVVGTAIANIPISGFPSGFPEQYVAADTDPLGWVYIGTDGSAGSGDVFRMRKDGTMLQNVRSSAGLGSGNLGWSMLVNGPQIYTLDDRTPASAGILWRISENGGSPWMVQDYATFGFAPNGPARDIAALVPGPTSASVSPLYMMARPLSGSGNIELWSLLGNASPPQAATREFSSPGPSQCSGLVVDDAAFYLACPSGPGIVRADRASGAITTIWGGFPPSSFSINRNALAGHDLDGNGLVDVLYFTGLTPQVHAICHPDSGSPEVHSLGSWSGSSSGSFGLAYDHVNRVLWSYHDGPRALIRIQ